MRSNVTDIDAILVHQTGAAILVKTDEDTTGVWLPKSQVEVHWGGDASGAVVVTVPDWLATEKGLV